MFDCMCLQESLLDLFDSGVNDDHLTLIHEANKDRRIKVKTPNGFYVEQTLKELLKNNPDYLFRYKN